MGNWQPAYGSRKSSTEPNVATTTVQRDAAAVQVTPKPPSRTGLPTVLHGAAAAEVVCTYGPGHGSVTQ
jgi:hypothetical protein